MAGANLVALAMVILLVYAMLAMASVLNFGLLPDFIVDYLISFFNKNNTKNFMYYDNWHYFRLYWITFIQKLSNSYSRTNSWYNLKSDRCSSLIE
ncbi:hypothetical protein [Bacillus cereus]|uniref:hypothetical protein n=1 Tax=Bacillus cereus TaxID=1396 RepID=UPI003C6C2D01